MLIWLANGLLAKAGQADPLPRHALRYCVAKELERPDVPLIDEDRPDQGELLAIAVTDVVAGLALAAGVQGPPIVVICAAGRSRSVTVACLALALYRSTSFDEQWQALHQLDSDLADPSPIWPLARLLFPGQFNGF